MSRGGGETTLDSRVRRKGMTQPMTPVTAARYPATLGGARLNSPSTSGAMTQAITPATLPDNTHKQTRAFRFCCYSFRRFTVKLVSGFQFHGFNDRRIWRSSFRITPVASECILSSIMITSFAFAITNSAFVITLASFAITVASLKITPASFAITEGAFVNTFASFVNTFVSFTNTRPSFTITRASFVNTHASFAISRSDPKISRLDENYPSGSCSASMLVISAMTMRSL
jgi:hypothetical protein